MKKLILLTNFVFISGLSFAQLTISKTIGEVRDSVKLLSDGTTYELNYIRINGGEGVYNKSGDNVSSFSFTGTKKDLENLYESFISIFRDKKGIKLTGTATHSIVNQEVDIVRIDNIDYIYFLKNSRDPLYTDRQSVPRSIYLSRQDIDKLFGKL